MAHTPAIARSAEAYIAHLQQVMAGAPSQEVTRLATATLETTATALDRGMRLTPREVSLNLHLVKTALIADPEGALGLLNTCALGLGARTPSAAFMGKEAAYDACMPVNFLLESLALTALWLCDGAPQIVSALVGSDVQCDFLRQPASLPFGTYPDVLRKPGHTWRKIARVLARRFGGPAGVDTWGEQAYLVEVGVVPSRQHKGCAPTKERTRFLKELVAEFAGTGTRTIVIHGREGHHADAHEEVVAAFLGVARPELKNLRSVPVDDKKAGQRIETWDFESRRVLRCRHLSNSVPGGFLHQVAGLIL